MRVPWRKVEEGGNSYISTVEVVTVLGPPDEKETEKVYPLSLSTPTGRPTERDLRLFGLS